MRSILLAAAIAVLPALAVAAPAEGGAQNQKFHAAMDKAFGAGRWRETSGWRSQERENELRREGAGTVPIGAISHHSMGSPDAPGAYDVVVPGMSNADAASKLRQSSDAFSRILAERAHGGEGEHLHVEPYADRLMVETPDPSAAGVAPSDPGDSIYLRVVGGRRNPELTRLSRRSGRRS
ncbi:MAG TPA: hypothetical protein VIC25_09565 [Caulobacteraceae bacterium]|jgi:hypothetical protein